MANIIQLSTGDLKNNLRKLQYHLRQIHCPHDLDLDGITTGSPTAYLPIYHYSLLEYSKPISLLLVEHKIELFAKSDRKFIETMFHALRELFSYKPPLSRDQFFTGGFVECKVIMCIQVLHLIQAKHAELTPGVLKTGKRGDKHVRIEAGVSGTGRVQGGVNPAGVGSSNGLTRIDTDVVSHLSAGFAQSNVKTLTNNLPASSHIIPTAFGDKNLTVMHHRPTNSATSSVQNTGHFSTSSSINNNGCKSENCVRKLESGVGTVRENAINRRVTDRLDVASGKPHLLEVSSNQLNKAVVFKKDGVSVVRESCLPMLTHDDQLIARKESGRVVGNGGGDSGWVGKSDSEDFLFNMLSSVSQTLLELVKRVDSINDRLSHLETSVSRQSRNFSVNSEKDLYDTERHNSFDLNDRDERTNEFKSNGGRKASTRNLLTEDPQLWSASNAEARNEASQYDWSRPVKDMEGKLLQSLNTINARITLLENSVTLLSNDQRQQQELVQREQRSDAEPGNGVQQYSLRDSNEPRQPYTQPHRLSERTAHLLESEEFMEGIESPRSAKAWGDRVVDWRSEDRLGSSENGNSVQKYPTDISHTLESVDREHPKSSYLASSYSTSSYSTSSQPTSSYLTSFYSSSSYPTSSYPISSCAATSSYSTSALATSHQASGTEAQSLSHNLLHSTSGHDKEGQDSRLPESINDDSVLTVDSCQSLHPATPPSLRNSSRIVESPPTKDFNYNEQAERIEAMLQSTRKLLSHDTT